MDSERGQAQVFYNLIMIIHWLPLVVGLVLGLIPSRLLINSECRYLIFEDLWGRVLWPENRGSDRRRRWWKMPLVWIDPVRGYVVADFLTQAFEAAPEASGIEQMLPTLARGGLLVLVVWVQSSLRLRERETISPTSFIAGITCALLPIEVALAVLVMGAASAIAMQTFVAGYIVATMTMLGVGFAMMGKSQTLAVALATMGLPVIINWLRGTRMVMPVRR